MTANNLIPHPPALPLQEGSAHKSFSVKQKITVGVIVLALLAALAAIALCNSNQTREDWANTPTAQENPAVYGAPPPQVGGVRWGMSREELIRTLDLQPNEYTVSIQTGSGNLQYSYVEMEIPDKPIPTPNGISSPTSFTFYEDEREIVPIGLFASTVCLNAPLQELREAVAAPFEITNISSRGSRIDMRSTATVGGCLPSGLRNGLWDYMANPGYPHNYTLKTTKDHITVGPDLLSLLDESEDFDLLLAYPIVHAQIKTLENQKTSYKLEGQLPAIFHMVSENLNDAGRLPFDFRSCFDSTVYDCRESVPTRKSINFMGLHVSSYEKTDARVTKEGEYYFQGIKLPAQRMTFKASYDYRNFTSGGQIEWFLPEAGDRQALIDQLIRELSKSLGEVKPVNSQELPDIHYKWLDDFGTRLYLQNDPEDGAVRIIVKA